VTRQHPTWAVPAWLVAALAAVSLVALTAAARADDGPSRLLFLVLGAATGAEALRGGLLRPTIAADAEGLDVVSGLRRIRVPWGSVRTIGAMGEPSTGARLRRRAEALEIDLGERLLLVPRYRLGAPVADVVSRLETIRTNGS